MFRNFTFKTNGLSRTETYDDKDYVVVPVVAMVEGIRHGGNQDTPELWIAEEFTKFPEGWNTKPVVLNHPQDTAGNYISAGSPDVLETYAFGQIFNSKAEDDKLKVEAWLDTSKRDLNKDVSRVFERIENGETIEISVAFYCTIDAVTYTSDYSGIVRNIVPDHLAILDENSIGACSVKDGCGIRANQLKTGKNMTKCSCKPEAAIKALELIRANSISDKSYFNDIQSAMYNALQKGMTNHDYFYIQGMTSNQVVYYYSGLDDHGKTYRRFYSADENLQIEFTSEPEEVIVSMDVKPLNVNSQEGSDMTVKTNSTPESIEDEVIIDSIPSTESGDVTSPDTIVAEPDTAPAPAAEVAVNVSIEDYIAAAPEAIRDMLQEGLRANNAKRTSLIKTIRANKANKFTEEFLKTQSTEVLENLSLLAASTKAQSVATQPISSVNMSNDSVPEVPRLFTKTKEVK